MNNALRKIAFFVGIGLLLVSMYWSQDGWNFDIAGQSGYGTLALAVGWFLAIAVTVMEFIFSSNYNELNKSLILFGALAYFYSIYTNYEGILHFQGTSPNNIGAAILAILMDAVPEPMIAWGLYVSRDGDLVGNIVQALMSAPDKAQKANLAQKTNNQPKFNENHRPEPKYRANLPIPQGNRAPSRHISPDFMKSLQSSRKFEKNLHGVNSDDEEME